ncbi:hypothetical protein N8766_01795 [bacterium]|mgnify:CR=1 FL=1|jgi:hypothetical protein|nr:hypothetical protein [Verrucomicrobiota bacterium]MDA7632819.1 hypothetical protein [bacterium]MDA7645167.1 hypothetical protein [bacterium]MDA7866944.1 hypothetical protein [Verrucomicrobiota bacterium]MDB4746015.1 hypothetical protein [Verrucomicrobiota bacterium]
MRIQFNQITSSLLFAITLGCLSQTVKAEPFHWNAYDLKVPPKNIGPLLELLEGAFSEPDKPFKVTLSETVFSDNDVTHQLTVSSADVNAISALMSDQIKESREKFMSALYQLAEIESSYTGVRAYTSNIPEKGSDAKKSGSYFGHWEIQIRPADAPEFIESFKNVVAATKDLRSNHILGMGTFQFGKGTATHYILHSFNSYADLKNGLEAYSQKEAMAVHFKTIKDIATPVGNHVSKIIKQW